MLAFNQNSRLIQALLTPQVPRLHTLFLININLHLNFFNNPVIAFQNTCVKSPEVTADCLSFSKYIVIACPMAAGQVSTQALHSPCILFSMNFDERAESFYGIRLR
jgi:hypothetical protein